MLQFGKIGRRIAGFWMALAITTVSGPFGTYEDLSFGPRLLYWSLALAGCGIQFHIILDWAFQSPIFLRLHRWLILTIGAALAAPLGAVIIFIVEWLMRGNMPNAEMAPFLMVSVFAIGMTLGFIHYMPPFARLLEGKAKPDIDLRDVVFLKRLPEHDTALISLSMQDHYVSVATDAGERRIKMRFADALEELEGYPGYRIHRSHWVAERAVLGAKLKGRSRHVVLSDNRRLPVSETYGASLLHLEENAKAGQPQGLAGST